MNHSTSLILALVSRIHSLSAEYTRKFLSEKGDYSSSHGFILYLLSTEGELAMGDIARRINRNKSTATALIKKLSDEDLVETFSSSQDNRKKYVRLTSRGKNFNCLTSEISSSLLSVCWKNFRDDEKENLLTLLEKMEKNLAQVVN